MKIAQRLLPVLLLCVFASGVVYAKEPTNLGIVKNKVVQYHDSGAYRRDINRVTLRALNYLKARVKQYKKNPQQDKLAIVLDIDETSLSNYSFLRASDFGFNGASFAKHVQAENAPAIKGVLRIARYANAHDVAVFFVTGRTEAERAATIKNLRRSGYHQWKKLVLKPASYSNKSVVPYKSGARRAIIDSGYDVVENIGDQYSDLTSGFDDHQYKLPDPFYYIP